MIHCAVCLASSAGSAEPAPCAAENVVGDEDLSVAGAYDTETPEAYCKRRGLDGELYDYLIEPTVRGGAG